jgi:uncharacterized protein (DUF488 family)
MEDASTAFTVGHSNHSLEAFLDLLERHGIEVVVDVRSSPYCRYATHFNKESLQHELRARRFRYLFLGDVIGGRPDGDEFYDADGRVLYGRLSESGQFKRGIQRLRDGIETYRVALMCGEEDPTECHRRLLIGRVLDGEGIRVLHIRGDGRLQSEEELAREEEFRKTKGQKTLFDMEEPDEWKSIQSVSPRRPPGSSSSLFGEPESNA